MVEFIQWANISGLVGVREIGPLSSKHLGHFVVGLLGRRARPLAKLTEKKLSNFLIGEFERNKLPCYYRVEGGERGEDQAFAGEVEQEGLGEGEGEDDSDEPEVLRLISTVHNNIRSRAPETTTKRISSGLKHWRPSQPMCLAWSKGDS